MSAYCRRQRWSCMQVGQALGRTDILGRYILLYYTFCDIYTFQTAASPVICLLGRVVVELFLNATLLRCWHGFVTIRVRKIRNEMKRNNNNNK